MCRQRTGVPGRWGELQKTRETPLPLRLCLSLTNQNQLLCFTNLYNVLCFRDQSKGMRLPNSLEVFNRLYTTDVLEGLFRFRPPTDRSDVRRYALCNAIYVRAFLSFLMVVGFSFIFHSPSNYPAKVGIGNILEIRRICIYFLRLCLDFFLKTEI